MTCFAAVQARADLESALPLMTRNPTSTIDDLLRSSSEREQLEGLSDGQLLRKAARASVGGGVPDPQARRGLLTCRPRGPVACWAVDERRLGKLSVG
jgi:hypothetical protein